ncbi:UDP-N-acetylmuramoyl-tripeptide--D-alanyl-D-alanine ligase [Aquipuribacter sp. SD81]|uniref:UDP-N-acetylmuramoyl-tripeptide--D-alanyl-D- alanine ligase n=1 Tax=Aquipuribacter sp. SD81 TaxID=3127703 RepID=UPI00301B4E21
MIARDAAEVAEVVGGRVLEGAAPAGAGDTRDPHPLTGVAVLDSRVAGPGDLFVAVPGSRVDGHDHVAGAVGAGAAAALVQHEVPGAESLAAPLVLVDDTPAALTTLARWTAARARENGTRTVGITGSAGKTTTKDLLAAVLRALTATAEDAARSPGDDGPGLVPGRDRVVVATPGSYNNELGLPLTVLRADATTRLLVLEMGARGAGHVAHLAGIARPDVAVVIGVGSAHLSEFGSREAIAEAKGELVEALDADDPAALAVLNGDDALVRAMADRTRAATVLFGTGLHCPVRAEDVDLDDDARLRFTLVDDRGHAAGPGRAPVRLRLTGEQHLPNALAAAAAALHLTGAAVADVAAALSQAAPASRYRMEVVDRPDGVRVVNDAYNASPEAVAAALRALAHVGRSAHPRRRTWAVLGEMLELGEHSREAHDRVGRLAVRLNIDRLVAVGPGALPLHAGAAHEGSWGEESVHVPDVDAARALLAEELAPGDVVLVKASNSVGLWRLGEELATAVAPVDGPGDRPGTRPSADPRTDPQETTR